MSLKKTKLIVRSNPDDLLKIKEELIKAKEAKKQLVKYSDQAVETNNKLYIFKVAPLPRNIIDQIRGYDEVDAEELLSDLHKFVEEVEKICGVYKEEPSEAQNATSESLNSRNEAKHEKDENSIDTNK